MSTQLHPLLASVPPIARICSTCGTPDRITDVFTDEKGQTSLEHFVTAELKFMDREGETSNEFRRHLRKGWTRKIIAERLAVERMTCRNCLNANSLRDNVWAEMKARARALEKDQNQGDKYWMSLVEDWA